MSNLNGLKKPYGESKASQYVAVLLTLAIVLTSGMLAISTEILFWPMFLKFVSSAVCMSIGALCISAGLKMIDNRYK